MVPFAGWEMPVQYPTGPIREHRTTRQVAGLFDIDHMGQIEVRGPDAEKFVNYMATYDVRRMARYDAHYALFCYDDGGTIDDLFIYRLPDPEDDRVDYFFLAVNAANRAKDYAWLKAHAADFDVHIKDISDETYMLAFQGPKAPLILDRMTPANLNEVPRFTAIQTEIEGVPVLLGRTGYTGEDGFELFFPVGHALDIWEAILEEGKSEGVIPVGLAARDSLRFEPCMPLYGHEISATISPVQARLTFGISFSKSFIGRDALLKQKLEKTGPVLAGFEMVERGVPREHYPVLHEGNEVGFVTTGMFSPTLKKYLGMAYIPRELSSPGTRIAILVRDKPLQAKTVEMPFYTPAYRR